MSDAERLAAIRSEIESGHDGKTWQAYETAVGAEYFAVEENRGLFAAKLAPVTGTPTYGRDEILHAIALHNGAPALLAELDRLIAENDALRARIEAALRPENIDYGHVDVALARVRAALAGDHPEATPEPYKCSQEPHPGREFYGDGACGECGYKPGFTTEETGGVRPVAAFSAVCSECGVLRPKAAHLKCFAQRPMAPATPTRFCTEQPAGPPLLSASTGSSHTPRTTSRGLPFGARDIGWSLIARLVLDGTCRRVREWIELPQAWAGRFWETTA